MTPRQHALKRALDLAIAVPLLVVTSPVMLLAACVSRAETGQSGFFRQVRVGRDGTLFEVMKVRTMRTSDSLQTTVTTRLDQRITRSGSWMRRWKIDELPQLVNVVRGQMSLVGPRPDVPGFADRLEGRDRMLLSLRPGITGPATLAYRHEETLLAAVPDPERYNAEVLWPAKVRINREYLSRWTIQQDLSCLMATMRRGPA
jgi:lipopolysaccharide/colanic/teichoic acid biosynthesis glycosyltransferase